MDEISLDKNIFQRNINDILAGIISGLLIIIISTAYTALVFKGPLLAYFSIGISYIVVGACLINLLTSTLSKFKYAIARPEPASGVILAIIFAHIININAPANTIFPTLLVAMALTSITVGLVMYFIGFFRAGNFFRFLPYPVLGGLISGIGFVMGKTSLSMMSNTAFEYIHLIQFNFMLPYILGITFAVLLIIATQKISHPLITPIFVLLYSILINFFLWVNHITHTEAVHSGWLFSAYSQLSLLPQSLHLSLFRQINWEAILHEITYLLGFSGVIILILLSNISALEVIEKEKVDLDHELKITGAGNFISGLLFQGPANLSFTGTLLNKELGATNRLSGIVATIVCLSILFILPTVFTYLPKPVIGGLLLYIALKLLTEWIVEGFKKLSHIDYCIVFSIMLIIGFWGFFPGLIIGIMTTCIIFIFRYAQINYIHFSTSGTDYHSNVIRPIEQQKLLEKEGKAIQIYKLQGFLFFGSAKKLVDEVSQFIERDSKQELRFLIFDFQLSPNVDSTAAYSFLRLQNLFDKIKIQIIFTGCSNKLIKSFKRHKIFGNNSPIIFFPNLDEGLEWCEDKLLETIPKAKLLITIENILSELLPEKNHQKTFIQYLEKIEVPKNHYLLKQGDFGDDLYFVASGKISIWLKTDSSDIRLSKCGHGTIIGEIGFYLREKRTSTVRTDTDAVVYKFTVDSMKKLEASYPDVALVFHKNMIRVLGTRLIQTNRFIQVLSQ